MANAILQNRKKSSDTTFELERAFNLTTSVGQKWIKKGLLVTRTIEDGKHIYLKLFLIGDNWAMLPPKELVDSHLLSK